MCVIVYKPEGVRLPIEETLRSCWEANPDGAGIMYPQGDSVSICKGFMEWEGFIDALRRVEREVEVEHLPLALHFRIATHGAVKPGCCHPFAVCAEYAQMRKSEQRAEVGFMHNGTLSGLDTSSAVSDSMAFARNVLAPLRQMCSDFVSDKRAMRIIEASTQGSRFLLMDGAGDVRTFGRWVERDGLLFSNDRFESTMRAAYGWTGTERHETLFDAFCAYGEMGKTELAQFGLFKPCAECPLLMDCAEYLPYCADEAQALEMVQAYSG